MDFGFPNLAQKGLPPPLPCDRGRLSHVQTHLKHVSLNYLNPIIPQKKKNTVRSLLLFMLII